MHLTGGEGGERASTVGVGELVAAALDAGARTVVVGLGGSGTNDGGAGLLPRSARPPTRPSTPGAVGLAGVGAVDLTAAARPGSVTSGWSPPATSTTR